MAGSLGTISGQIRLDVSNAIAGYAAVRAANAQTINTMNDARNRMRGFGVGAVAMGASFLAGFGMAVNAAADFEKKLDYFGAVNNATAAEMEKVRAKALELGRTSQFSAGQVADAFVEMGKAGVSAKDITEGMADAMINLASAADIDLAQATNIVTSQIQAFGLAAKDATHVTDLMAGAANASIIDVQDIGVSMKYVAGVAHSLGISIDSTTDAISLLGKAGIKGSTAGTSLRQIMVSLAGGTDKAKAELQELGIITEDGSNKFFTAEGKAKSLSQIFQILQDHTAGLTQKQRLMAFRTIFNNRALAAAQILTKEGAKGFKEMNDEISKTTAADVAAKRMDNLSGDIKKLKGNLETLMIEAGTPFQAFLRGIVQWLTKVVQAFAALPGWVQTSIMTFMLVAGVVLVVAGTIAIFAAAIGGAIGAVRSTIGAFKAMWLILKAVAVAMRAMAIAALANPYVLIALAVIALVAGLVLLYKKSEAFRNFMNMIGRGLKTAFFAVVEWFKTLPEFFAGVWKTISGWFETGVGWVKQNWDILLAIFTGPIGLIILVVRRFGDTIATFLSSIPGRIMGYITTAWNAFLSFLTNLPYYIGFAIGFVFGTLVKWGIQVGVWAYMAGRAVVDGFVWFFTELPGIIWGWLVQAWNAFIRWGSDMITGAKNTGIGIYDAIVSFFQKLPGRVIAFSIGMYNGAKNAWNSLLTGAKNLGINVYNAIVTWFQKLPGRVINFVTSAKNGFVRTGSSIISAAKNLGSRALSGVMQFLTQLPGKVWGILGRVKDAFWKVIKSAYNSAKSLGKGLWDGFKAGIGINSPSYIEKAMFAISATTDREGKKLRGQVRNMQGLSRGLQTVQDRMAASGSKTDWVASAARALANQNTNAQAILSSKLQLNAERARARARAAAATASQMASGTPQDQRPIHVEVHNPIAERASDSAAKKLRTLASMGAF